MTNELLHTAVFYHYRGFTYFRTNFDYKGFIAEITREHTDLNWACLISNMDGSVNKWTKGQAMPDLLEPGVENE